MQRIGQHAFTFVAGFLCFLRGVHRVGDFRDVPGPWRVACECKTCGLTFPRPDGNFNCLTRPGPIF